MKIKNFIVIFIVTFALGCLLTFALIGIHNSKKADKKIEKDYIGTICISGVEIYVPDAYIAITSRQEGTVIYYDDSTFYMGIQVIEGEYEKSEDTLQSWTDIYGETINITKPFVEFSIDGRSYSYCVWDNAGDIWMVVCTEIDDTRMFRAHIRCDALNQIRPQFEEESIYEYERLILILDELLKDAKPTEKEDTPAGEILFGKYVTEQLNFNIETTFYDTGYLEDVNGNEVVSYGVEDGFYMISQLKHSNYTSNTYATEDLSLRATVVSYDKDIIGSNAKEAILSNYEIYGDEQSAIEEYNMNGYTYYYYDYEEVYYEYDRPVSKYYLEIMVDLNNGFVYRVSVNSKNENDIDVNNFLKFLTVEEVSE